MSDRLDDLFERLRAEPLDRSLSTLEADVRQRLACRSAPFGADFVFAPLRSATIAASLLLGVAIGGTTAATAMADSRPVLTTGAELAPSTLLEGRR